MEGLLPRNSLSKPPRAICGREAGTTPPRFTAEDAVGSLPGLGCICVHLPLPSGQWASEPLDWDRGP